MTNIVKMAAAIEGHKLALINGDKRKIKRACRKFFLTLDPTRDTKAWHNEKGKFYRKSVKASKRI